VAAADLEQAVGRADLDRDGAELVQRYRRGSGLGWRGS
jgi:hypothetical protein